MSATAGLAIDIEWWPHADVTDRVKRKLQQRLEGLAPVLNEYEAMLFDLANLASNGFDYLMPKIELNLPLYEERRVFRIRMSRLDDTQVLIETRGGRAIAEVRIRH